MADDTAEAPPGRQAKRAGVDIKALSAAELRQLIEDAQGELVAKQESAKAELRAKWEKEAAEAGLSIQAVLPLSGGRSESGKRPKKGGDAADGARQLPVKYRGPNGEEWSGRGRLPKWLQVAEAEGKKRDDFSVSKR